MKTSIRFIFLLLLVSNTLLGQHDPEDDFLKFPLKSITRYCQTNPDSAFSKVVLTYDKDNRLIKKSSHGDSIESGKIIYNYNAIGSLIAKEFYNCYDNCTSPQSVRLFKYDDKNRLLNEWTEGEVNIVNEYAYNKLGQLESSTSHCRYYNFVYTYNYDSNGRVIEKYKNGQIEVRYEYSQDHLLKETHYFRSGDKEITYEYDTNGSLITKKENGKVIETNIYNNGKLIERWSYYFGIDPGYYPCNNQLIIKYEYY